MHCIVDQQRCGPYILTAVGLVQVGLRMLCLVPGAVQRYVARVIAPWLLSGCGKRIESSVIAVESTAIAVIHTASRLQKKNICSRNNKHAVRYSGSHDTLENLPRDP